LLVEVEKIRSVELQKVFYHVLTVDNDDDVKHFQKKKGKKGSFVNHLVPDPQHDSFLLLLIPFTLSSYKSS
jgi:hypothetical protein